MQKYLICFEKGDWKGFRNLHSHNVNVHLNGTQKLFGCYPGLTYFMDNDI